MLGPIYASSMTLLLNFAQSTPATAPANSSTHTPAPVNPATPAVTPVDFPAPTAAAGFLYKTLDFDGQKFAYCVYVPPAYDPAKPWPVILFLHGSGQCGEDGFNQTDIGLPQAIRKSSLRPPAVIVMPQCRKEKTWTADMAKMALACVDKTSSEYTLDPDRFYLTGLSLGGAGTWTIAATFHDRIAAIAPVCGFGNPADAPKLAEIPTWVFHGGADNRVPVARSREMVEAIRKAGGKPQYTEYPGVGHESWDKAYREADLWKWMFAQKLSDRQPAQKSARPKNP